MSEKSIAIADQPNGRAVAACDAARKVVGESRLIQLVAPACRALVVSARGGIIAADSDTLLIPTESQSYCDIYSKGMTTVAMNTGAAWYNDTLYLIGGDILGLQSNSLDLSAGLETADITLATNVLPDLPAGFTGYGISACYSTGDGTVYVLGSHGRIASIDLTAGSPEWTLHPVNLGVLFTNGATMTGNGLSGGNFRLLLAPDGAPAIYETDMETYSLSPAANTPAGAGCLGFSFHLDWWPVWFDITTKRLYWWNGSEWSAIGPALDAAVAEFCRVGCIGERVFVFFVDSIKYASLSLADPDSGWRLAANDFLSGERGTIVFTPESTAYGAPYLCWAGGETVGGGVANSIVAFQQRPVPGFFADSLLCGDCTTLKVSVRAPATTDGTAVEVAPIIYNQAGDVLAVLEKKTLGPILTGVKSDADNETWGQAQWDISGAYRVALYVAATTPATISNGGLSLLMAVI